MNCKQNLIFILSLVYWPVLRLSIRDTRQCFTPPVPCDTIKEKSFQSAQRGYSHEFAIIGAGGTGGVLGGYLAHAGNDVTFLARGRHLQAMQENGLLIRTNHRGDIRIPKVKACTMDEYLQAKETPDVLFVCVKYYSLPDAIEFARHAAGKETLIIPILNVFGSGAVMQEKLPGLTALDGCIYVFAKIAEPGVIAQPQSILRVFYGFRPGQSQELRERLGSLRPSCARLTSMHISPTRSSAMP